MRTFDVVYYIGLSDSSFSSPPSRLLPSIQDRPLGLAVQGEIVINVDFELLWGSGRRIQLKRFDILEILLGVIIGIIASFVFVFTFKFRKGYRNIRTSSEGS